MGDKSVIVADDDELIRVTFRMAIEQVGAQVVTVADGDALLAQLRARKFDLCIMDASMPGPGLPERLAEIRRISPITAVLVISGYSELPGDTVIEDGVRFLQKPIELGALGSVLDDLGITTASPGR